MSYGQFALKKQKQCLVQEPEAGDCWIGLSLASDSGLIVGSIPLWRKHQIASVPLR